MSTEPFDLSSRKLRVTPTVSFLLLKTADQEDPSGNGPIREDHSVFHLATPTTRAYSDKRIRFALEMMISSTKGPTHVHTIASLLGLSSSRFRHLFKEKMGIAFHRYEIVLRLDRARFLLRTTDCSVREAAGMVGFADVANFTHAFKKAFGVTPGRSRVAGPHPVRGEHPVSASEVRLSN